MMNLTLAYFTSRKEPHIEWFLTSIRREFGGDYSGLHVIVVDYHCVNQERKDWLVHKLGQEEMGSLSVKHVPPKPTIWQGPHRLTKNNYFAASNARNTAFCLCTDNFIACVDDLSVMEIGWLDQVRHAMQHKYLVMGSYKKVYGLKVDTTAAYTFDHEKKISWDSRWPGGKETGIVKVTGSWLFGCSFGLPIEWAIKVNGFDEICDGAGAEDYDFGIRLQRAGLKMFYNRNMHTVESEEGHSSEGNEHFIRKAKDMHYNGKTQGSDHVLLYRVLHEARIRTISKEYDLGELRKKVLEGEPFPIMKNPRHDWRDSQLLEEM